MNVQLDHSMLQITSDIHPPMEYPVSKLPEQNYNQIRYEADTMRDDNESARDSVLPTPRNEEWESKIISPMA